MTFFVAFTTMAMSPATAARRAALHDPVTAALRTGHTLLTGVDEAGAGALAGPVVAAAVQLAPYATGLHIPGLDDSKRLSAPRRAQIYQHLFASPLICCAVHVSPAHRVDELNVLQARLRAMAASVRQLPRTPGLLFVDGDRLLPDLVCLQRAVVHGDAQISLVAAASIIAKVARDRIMCDHADEFPPFSFGKHFGYGTRQHMLELKTSGPCRIHRMSFRPVREAAT